MLLLVSKILLVAWHLQQQGMGCPVDGRSCAPLMQSSLHARCFTRNHGIGMTQFAIETERLMWHLFWHREAKGMEAVAHLMGQGVQLRAGALTQQGAATVAAAARLLEATLEAGVQPAARAFADAGGFAALRMGIACAQLSSQLGLEVLLSI